MLYGVRCSERFKKKQKKKERKLVTCLQKKQDSKVKESYLKISTTSSFLCFICVNGYRQKNKIEKHNFFLHRLSMFNFSFV